MYQWGTLLENKSDVRPTEIHADTQGQSLPVFGLVHLLGFELLPRIRNWQDLTLYGPAATLATRTSDSLSVRTRWTGSSSKPTGKT